MLRTHTCGELSEKHVGQTATLSGWVARVRDHGGVNFIDLRDRWGITQVVFRPDDKQLHAAGRDLRPEFCVRVTGGIGKRPAGTENANIPTGRIEMTASELVVYSKSATPPFEIHGDSPVGEEARLEYRYLDLRRPQMQEALIFRGKLIQAMREFLSRENFVEFETPILTKSTPEGARDYLVPSRLNHGQFFALPQSPQLFKQLLMVSGFDRYYQVAKCFRDEDLRADRQPEFTQLDVEMSFVDKEDVFRAVEGTFAHLFKTVVGKPLATPFPRLPYKDAMRLYGSDKPDLRFGLPIADLSSVLKGSGFNVFKSALELKDGVVLGLRVPKPETPFSRKDFDDLIEFAKANGAKGLAYAAADAQGGLDSPIAKFLKPDEITAIRGALGAELKPGLGPPGCVAGDLVFFAADARKKAQSVLGAVRLRLGQKLKLIPENVFSFTWIDEFPLFNYNEETKGWDSEHHPFTGPHPDDVAKLGTDNGAIRSLSYDLVLNGNELASGSIRIHDAAVQRKVFETIGIGAEEAEKRFGFLLKAFKYGPPPHGGIAVGVDRLVAILLGRESIREVVAFPKTQRAYCPMTDAPSPVDDRQLKDLGIKIL